MSTMMKAFYVKGEDAELRSIPVPVPGRNEVLIKVLRAGICNTDIEILKGVTQSVEELNRTVTETEPSNFQARENPEGLRRLATCEEAECKGAITPLQSAALRESAFDAGNSQLPFIRSNQLRNQR